MHQCWRCQRTRRRPSLDLRATTTLTQPQRTWSGTSSTSPPSRTSPSPPTTQCFQESRSHTFSTMVLDTSTWSIRNSPRTTKRFLSASALQAIFTWTAPARGSQAPCQKSRLSSSSATQSIAPILTISSRVSGCQNVVMVQLSHGHILITLVSCCCLELLLSSKSTTLTTSCWPVLYHLEQYAAGYSFEEIVAEELLILKECIARPGSKKWTEFLKCHSEEATKSKCDPTLKKIMAVAPCFFPLVFCQGLDDSVPNF